MMNLKYITIAAVLMFTFFGCVSEIKKITYDVQGVNYTIKIPKGYKWLEYSTIEENMVELSYSDSSCIYLGSSDMTPNKKNIKPLNDSIYLLRFQNKPLAEDVNKAIGSNVVKIRTDTLDISGHDTKGLLWRDIIIGNICVGYKDVKDSNKQLFDIAIKSLSY